MCEDSQTFTIYYFSYYFLISHLCFSFQDNVWTLQFIEFLTPYQNLIAQLIVITTHVVDQQTSGKYLVWTGQKIVNYSMLLNGRNLATCKKTKPTIILWCFNHKEWVYSVRTIFPRSKHVTVDFLYKSRHAFFFY